MRVDAKNMRRLAKLWAFFVYLVNKERQIGYLHGLLSPRPHFTGFKTPQKKDDKRNRQDLTTRNKGMDKIDKMGFRIDQTYRSVFLNKLG